MVCLIMQTITMLLCILNADGDHDEPFVDADIVSVKEVNRGHEVKLDASDSTDCGDYMWEHKV